MPFKLSTVLVLTFSIAVAEGDQSDSQQDTLLFQLRPVTVTASRLETADINLPVAVTTLGESEISLGQRQLVLNESLAAVPGLYVLNAENFAQDLRVAIRGFGSRAAFGIRGIKILVDGIPESTPDGQSQVDNIDLGFISRVEVLRGSVSAFYGNASGGVIALSSPLPPAGWMVDARVSGGDYGFRQHRLSAGQTLGTVSYLVTVSRNESGGFRRHSEMNSSIMNGKMNWKLNPRFNLTILASRADSPLANDPGALTREGMTDRTAAREQNVIFNAGEELLQSRAGVVAEMSLSDYQTLTVRGHISERKFRNRLPFVNGGQVRFERNFSGGGLLYTASGRFLSRAYRLSAGIDLEDQRDDRHRFDNLEGVRGDETLHQLERFRSLGAFVEEEVRVTESIWLTLGGRLDAIDISVKDKFMNNGDDSGERQFTAFSPLVGVVYSFKYGMKLYGNVTTSFETPTLNELSSNPDEAGGFNGELNPQHAKNFEVGLKGILHRRLRFDLALFRINLTDELVPYELEAFPGRTFYRNAGSTERQGVEAGAKALLGKGLTFSVSATLSNFRYRDFKTPDAVLDGKILPGIPAQFGTGELVYVTPSRLYVKVQTRFSGDFYADDANEMVEPSYSFVYLRIGFRKQFAEWLIEPFVGVNNLLGVEYSANVRLNAWGGRYFEPAPGRYFYGGVRVRVEK
ncbi:MAG: TonB-dependent receptor [Candidatus Neomarinimicrobiota bacterium]|nr:TonB-dependent receptor [Candidatus Neomarinimicrobiota bacterium]